MRDADPSGWLLRDVEIDGMRTDVRIRGERIHRIGPRLAEEPGEALLDAAGGALLPGLHDHHLHLMALGAALRSVRCGPPWVASAEALARALAAAARDADPERGLRGVGYHERVAGDLDRHALDRLGPPLPIRIQHRTGARWILNSRALARLGDLTGTALPPGVELDGAGEPTGRIDRADEWLRARLGESAPPDLARVGALLTSFGVTGACDATATNDAAALRVLEQASTGGALPQRLLVMGRLDLPEPRAPKLRRGALKVMLDENALPDREALIVAIHTSHQTGRGVAFHCVTRAELVFAASALEEAGCTPWDRIEHASIAPPDCVDWLARLPLAVVTQPNFVRERGDAYALDVEPDDRPWLYRGRAFLDAGIPLAGGTDAPFGDPDPWRAMRAAVARRSAGGVVLGADEALTPEEALALFVTPLESPGRQARRLAAGAIADLCLLARPWSAARDRLDAEDVAGTWVMGRRVSADM